MAAFPSKRLRAGAILFALLVLGPSPASPPSSGGALPSWREGLAARLAAAEYQPSPGTSGPSAPNRAHGLRLSWRDDGVAVDDRLSGERLVTLTTLGLGRDAHLEPLGTARAQLTSSGRVERTWPQLTEWWLNSADGAEQGWTLVERPSGQGSLVLQVAVAGAEVLATGDGLALESKAGRVLSYGHLAARDAAGRELAAHLAVDPQGFRLEVDDDDASYPIVIDPLLTSASWITEGNQLLAAFGYSVASAGDVNGDGFSDVIVGAHLFDNGFTDEGQAFVYHGSAAGLSTTPAWTADSDQPLAYFGQSVASAGDVNDDGFSDVIIGAPQYTNDQTQEGRVFVYLGSATGLSSMPWTTERNVANASFGASVASAGDVDDDGYSDIIIGAFRTPMGGLAVVHRGGPGGLDPMAAWETGTPQMGAAFGVSVASAGDVNGDGYSDIIVGASSYDQGQTDEGQAFIYRGGPAGPEINAAWIVEGNQDDARLGSSVASAGDVNGDGLSDVLVGVRGYTNGHLNEGRVLGFYGRTGALFTTSSWQFESNQDGALMGSSVASAGDVNGDGFSDVLVGAPSFDGVVTNEGRVSLFFGGAAGLGTAPAWSTSGQALSSFGASVASAGDVNGDGFSDVIIGAADHDNGATDEGRAVVFLGYASGLPVGTTWSVSGPQAAALLGSSVASAGDVNGDGYSDILVSAPQFDRGGADEGVVFLYLGSPTGVPTGTPSVTLEGSQASSFFGYSVASAGDVNGDGFGDVIIGAFGYDDPQMNEGRVSVYLGAAVSPLGLPPWTVESNQEDSNFGLSVASAGDVNGDGYSDVIVGAPRFDGLVTDEGAAFVYLGSATGLTTQRWTTTSNQQQAYLGTSVASAGDVNGDGYSDVIVGAPAYSNSQSNEGRVTVFAGSATGLALTPLATLEVNQQSAFFGTSVASAGDVNGDGLSDVIVGAPRFENVEVGEGAAFVFPGDPNGVNPSAWRAEGNQNNAGFGGSVASAGDVNGDGFSDVIVGAEQFSNIQTAEGRAFVFHGSAAGLLPSATRTFEPNQMGAAFGHSVASAGDVNGDGFSDVIIGASSFDAFALDVGGAVVVQGGDGLAGLPRQLTQDFGGPRGAGANVSLPGVLKGRMVDATGAPTPRHQFEFEVKPVGTRFDGLGGVRSMRVAGGALSTATVQSLAPGRYHWRARVRSGASLGRWVSFGGNQEFEADFVVRAVMPTDDGGLDGGAPDGGGPDAGVSDGGRLDAGVLDAGPFDAGVPDAGPFDAGVPDAGPFDAGVLDGGPFDAGTLDAGDADAGAADGGTAGLVFVPACGCLVAPADLSVLVLVALWWRRRR
ncbi:MAG: integrin alpha [Myxococcales bacterium]|nr:integrin alpha [Myxococcales bacterium]